MLKLSSQNNIAKLLQNLPSKVPFDKDFLKLDLHSINERFKDAKASIDESKIEINCTTSPVSFKDVKLGRFNINLTVPHNLIVSQDRLLGFPYSFLKIKSLKPNYSITGNLLFHPHLSDHMICLGDADEPVRKAIQTRSLEDVFILIDNMLRSDGDDTNDIIDQWKSFKCRNCESSVKNEPNRCVSCFEDVCRNCSRVCKKCKDRVHMGCGHLKGKKKPYIVCNMCI